MTDKNKAAEPWETHNAHPLAIRKRVWEEETAKAKGAPPSSRASTPAAGDDDGPKKGAAR